MNQKAFDLIVSKLAGVLEPKGFERQSELVQEENGTMALFIGEAAVYSVLYNEEETRFELRTADMTDEGPDDNWRSISNWIFDDQHDGIKEAESIANDFIETLQGNNRQEAIRRAKRKAHKDKDNNPDPIFFFKRLVSVFPELKDEIANETVAYESFRGVTFAREFVLPKVQAQAKKQGAESTKKLASLFEDFYKNGDMDVRSIITMVLLNGISHEQDRANILEHMSPAFQKYYRRALPYRTKKVRPEKEKRKRNLRDTSGDTPERLSGKIPKH